MKTPNPALAKVLKHLHYPLKGYCHIAGMLPEMQRQLQV